MQNRYTADIGDFAKYGLLRALSKDLELGVAWYLYPDEGHNSDGKHIDYLEQAEKWRHLDPELFDGLSEIVANNCRTTGQIEHSRILGDTTFSSRMLDFAGNTGERAQQRRQWFQDVESSLSKCTLIFADPDNGLYEDEKYDSAKKEHWKRISLSEVNALTQGRTGVIYHHNSRYPGGHAVEIQYWLSQLGRDAIALYWRPYSPRTFFIVNPTALIEKRARRFAETWSPNFELHTYQGTVIHRTPANSKKPRQLDASEKRHKVCPECGHQFNGYGWGGIDAHWKSRHEHLMPYKEAWPLIRFGNWKKEGRS